MFVQLLWIMVALVVGLSALAWWGSSPEREHQEASEGKE